MKTRCLFSASLSLAAVGACLLSISCETESAGGGGSLSISPSEVNLGVGRSVTLKARGGETYTWTMESNGTNNVGRLSNYTGSTTTYTALSATGEDVVIRVSSSVSTIQADSSSTSFTTNQAPTVNTSSASAIAIIHQR